MPIPEYQPGDGGTGDDSPPEQRDDTFYLPADIPGADTIKEGDTLTFKVVGKSEDGIEVEQVSDEPEPGESEDIGSALEKHMNTK